MGKRLFLILAACLAALAGHQLNAGPVSPGRALEIGKRLLEGPSTRGGEARVSIIWDGETTPSAQTPAFYVIGRDGGGLLTGEGVQTVSQNAESAKQKASETVQKASETTQETLEKLQGAIAPQDDGVLTVTVREDKLLYKGKEVTLGQLEEALLKDYKAGSSTVELKDDHAIKASYDEVKALLQKLSIPFTVGK